MIRIGNKKTETRDFSLLLSGLDKIKKEAGQNLGGNEELKKELNLKIDSIFIEKEIKTINEKVNDLVVIISRNPEIGKGSEVGIIAKRIELATKELARQNPKELEELKKEIFEKDFIKETKKINSELNENQLEKIKDYSKLVSENSFKESILNQQENDALEANSKVFSPGRLENAWMDLKQTFNFLEKKPEEIKEIKERYKSIKEGLKNINLPGGFKEVRSFEKILAEFNNPNTDQLFSKTKNYLGWADRVDKLTGGWLKKTTTDFGLKVVNKVGGQITQEFATNSLNVIAQQGFQKGFNTVLKGILSGGVKTAGTTAATTGATAATAAGTTAATGGIAATGATAATGVGIPVAIIMAVVQVAIFLKKQVNKVAEKLGISTKRFFEENFGKVGGKVLSGITSLIALPTLLIGTISAVAIAPILIGLLGGLFLYQMMQGNLVSSLVPPKNIGDSPSVENINSVWGGDCVNRDYPRNIKFKNTDDGQIFAIFEETERNPSGKIGQLYDLACVDPFNLVPVEKYTVYSNNKLDKRVVNSFYKMYEAGQAAGLLKGELMLVDGYRSNEDQARIREIWKKRIAVVFYAGGYSKPGEWTCEFLRDSYYSQMSLGEKIEKCTSQYASLPGVSNHLTGRAVDLKVTNTTTYNWLKKNGVNYGFGYNYSLEKWHWEYNPAP